MTERSDVIHVVIPDTQAKRHVPTRHLEWVGTYIGEKFGGRANVKLIHLGDHWDMPSLSSYDRKGGKLMEGRRYTHDVNAGNDAWRILNNAITSSAPKRWFPEAHFLFGNHEERIERASSEDAQLDGLVTLEDLAVNHDARWTTHPFLKPVWLDGIAYAHYFANRMTGRALGGQSMDARIKTVGHSFSMGHQQGLWFGRRETIAGAQLGLVAGSCFTPEHKVLTADLRYVPLGKVSPGDKLVSFDENVGDSPGRSRRYKTGTVRRVKRDFAPVFDVQLSNGKTLTATGDHLWLARSGSGQYRWRTTASLRVGTRIPHVLPEWEPLDGYAAGYLAGMYDGEGCYYTRTTTAGTVGQLTLSQKPGPVLRQAQTLLEDVVGVGNLTDTNQRGVSSLRIKGGMRNIAQVLGQIRPVRLLSKFEPEHLGRLSAADAHCPSVVSIAPAGTQEIVRIDIDAGTMVVEGTPQHNCYLHDEEYLGHQGNQHWRGIVICYDVRRGDYDPKFVSLGSLCKRYEGKTLAQYKGRH